MVTREALEGGIMDMMLALERAVMVEGVALGVEVDSEAVAEVDSEVEEGFEDRGRLAISTEFTLGILAGRCLVGPFFLQDLLMHRGSYPQVLMVLLNEGL
jgi:hypothetical protein